jgi:hypothetical protein
MTQEMHLLGETIQEVTLAAWPVVWAFTEKKSKEYVSTMEG